MVTSALGRRDGRCRRREPISAPGKSLAASSAAADQLQRVGPVQAHAALRGVHRLGDAEAERPQVPPERDRRVPVDRGVEPRIAVGERIGDHMRGRIGDAVELRRRAAASAARSARRWCRARSVPSAGRAAEIVAMRASPQTFSAGTSIQRRSLPALAGRARRAARPWRLRAGPLATARPSTDVADEHLPLRS